MIISELGDAAGHSVYFNTSLHHRREPLVCSPNDALNIFNDIWRKNLDDENA
jgi:predicted NodU family carbamoyl transferase